MSRPRLTDDNHRYQRELARIWMEATFSRALASPAESPTAASSRDIRRLPELASKFLPDIEPFEWGPTLKELLKGSRDHGSSLHALRGLDSTIIRHIYSYSASEWAKHVTLTLPASCIGQIIGRQQPDLYVFPRGRQGGENFGAREPIRGRVEGQLTPAPLPGAHTGHVAWASCGKVEFPEHEHRNVNMMPFVFGDKSSLPENLQCYYDSCIEKCPYMQEEVGKVGYLTVHESFVEASSAQRRMGLHIESPGVFSDDPNATKFSPAVEHRWGCGVFYEPDHYHGGIYMASTVADTSEVWDALVDKKIKGIVDRHGGCEHLRPLMRGTSTKLQANQLIWMTDCTPHEALPQKEAGYRQFFRVVTSHVSHWYADHSTANPLVPLPDHVTVVHGSKFD